MRQPLCIAVLMAAALAMAGCGPAPKVEIVEPAAPEYPESLVAAAEEMLGLEAEILEHGDLAMTGRPQALIIQRLKARPEGAPPGTLLSRAAVLEEQADATWRQIFLCDRHLRNLEGYMGGTPLAPVPAWRLQHEISAEHGLVMYFTPLAAPAGGHIVTLGVRWNPRVRRYQTLDREFRSFQNEAPTLERIR
jgi:hypothetical protein